MSKGKRFTGNDASSSSGFGASLNAPLLSDQTTMGDHPPPPVDFPKDLKVQQSILLEYPINSKDSKMKM